MPNNWEVEERAAVLLGQNGVDPSGGGATQLTIHRQIACWGRGVGRGREEKDRHAGTEWGVAGSVTHHGNMGTDFVTKVTGHLTVEVQKEYRNVSLHSGTGCPVSETNRHHRTTNDCEGRTEPAFY